MWNVISASVRGTSHRKEDLPCQDSVGHRVKDSCLLVAVADGLGSAPLSDRGSQIAIQAVLDSLEQGIGGNHRSGEQSSLQEIMRDAFKQARAALDEQAKTEDVLVRQFATTLTCLVVGDEWLVAGQIGDSFAVVETEEAGLYTVIIPERHEYAGAVTPLTASNFSQKVKVTSARQRVRSVILSSDGLVNLAVLKDTRYTRYEPHKPFFQPLLLFARNSVDLPQAASELAGFLESERVCTRTDDDKTLLIATRQPATAVGEQVGEGIIEVESEPWQEDVREERDLVATESDALRQDTEEERASAADMEIAGVQAKRDETETQPGPSQQEIKVGAKPDQKLTSESVEKVETTDDKFKNEGKID